MKKCLILISAALIALFMVYGSGEKGAHVTKGPDLRGKPAENAAKVKLDVNFGKIPLYFIHNKGQVDKKAAFYARTSRYTLWITKEGLVFDSMKREKVEESSGKIHSKFKIQNSKLLKRDVSRLMFVGAKKNPEMASINETRLRVNYFKGNDRSKWYGDVPTSQAVMYKGLYKNVDLKVYGIEKQIEYDWVVKPGGNPGDIRFQYKNVKGTRLDKEGNLIIETDTGELIHKKPVGYQRVGVGAGPRACPSSGNKNQIDVDVTFKKIGENIYGFDVGDYDRNCELIIDPLVLLYSTYLGGSMEDGGYAAAVDGSGYVYVAGYTHSPDFPVLGQYMADPGDGYYDVFVTKLDTTQSGSSSLIYSTYLGGSSDDSAYGIAVDNEGNAYVAGRTYSTDYPCLNQYMTEPGDNSNYDAIVTKLDTTQTGESSLIYSTYLGGNDYDCAYGIAVDANGYAYVGGQTWSTDFPCLNQYQLDQVRDDVFVTKLDTSQSGESSLLYSTYLGGSDWDGGLGIAVDANENVYVTGYTSSTNFPRLNQYMSDPDGSNPDAFVARLDTTREGTSSLIYSTYLGGPNGDRGNAIAVDAEGYAYVTGYTGGCGYPLKNQYQLEGYATDAFVTKLDTGQSGEASLLYSTYLGGQFWDEGSGIAVDNNGNAYVTGYTESTDFPCLNQYQSDQESEDVFVTKIDTTQSGEASLVYSTYLGGSNNDWGHGIAVDSSGNVYVTGETESTDFPTLNQYMTDPGDSYTTDAFLAKLNIFEVVLPTVTTTPPSSITTTSASGGGEVTSDGGAEVTARGVCWSTSENPTTDDDHTTDGSGTGSFTSSLTNLTPNTVYYVRAYATNSVGTAYGNEETFETDDPSITVTYPNGGETLVVGSGLIITWTSDAVEGNVKIEYSINNGGDWTGITASTENDGSYPWTVPAAPSYQCLIRVSETDGSPADTSDGVFTIATSSIVIPASEREALIALYNSTNGDHWLARTNWKKPDGSFNDPGTEHTWYGITVENNHVKEIDLSYNELEGTLPVEIGNFPYLTKLDLKQDGSPHSYDPISGPIPGTIGNLTQLKYLDFSGNDFDGNIPTGIGNLTDLEFLNLDDNDLTGGIPSGLGNLVNLQTLRILSNQLSGSIPDSLTNLVNLRYLNLGSNDLGGNIPSEIGNLILLEYLNLRANALTGGIPSGLGNLVNLNTLWLRGNKLIGSIPTGLTSLTGLSDTDIGYNALYTDDDTLVAFLNQEDPDWESTQTIAPADVSAAALSNSSIEVTWTPITYTAGDGGYRVLYSTTQGGPYTFFGMTVDKTVSSMIVTGLNPGTPYYFVVQTRSQPGVFNGNTLDSEYSNEVSDTTYFAITVTSPNGGENWDAGSVHAITWTSEGTVGNVMIEYSINGGSTWTKITGSTEDDGSYNWLIPNRPSNNCLIRVSGNDADEGSVDVSDAVFSIVSPTPGSLTLRSPNGGETWTAGSAREIKWGSTGDINQVTIEYSRDNGTTWKTIAQSTANNGSYNWVVPDTASNKCLVRVTANDGGEDPRPSDVSDAVFSIVLPPTPVIKVTAPNGGEQLLGGSRFTITWYAANFRDDVRIEYSINGGETWTEITGAVENNGKYAWTVPDTPSENCLVRIGETDGQPVDTSDAVFSIVSSSPGDITVLSPNGGETWTAGSGQEIKWTASGEINQVTIDYSTDNGNTWKTIVQTTPNDGSFDWVVPDTASEKCLVRVTSNDGVGDPRPSDRSDRTFSIVLPDLPTITVKTPNGGEQLMIGSRYDITWLSSGTREAVKIEYSVNGGDSWIEIAGSTENDGKYDWAVPDTPSETCLVRIGETDGQPVDISDAVFSIVSPSPGDITVTSPNGGENWTAGSEQEITWTHSGDINNVTIEYSTDYGTTWGVIVQTTANDNSHNWIVPDTPSDNCLVRIRANDDDLDPKPSDVSDDVFSIVSSSPSFKVTSPNGGETWEVGSIHSITWNSTGDINDVTIEYSSDNGTTWSTIVSSAGNRGTYDWTIPDTVSDECLVRVSANDGAGDPRPTDVSDEVFSIVLPSSPTIRVLTPNGGEHLVIGTQYEITWFGWFGNDDTRPEVKIEYSLNGGETWKEIAAVTENDGDYDWPVPDEPSETCLVRISEIDGQPMDISDAVFSIVSPIPGDLTVTSPNGGETLETGSQHNITWTCGGINYVIIEYSVDNGDSWLYIDRVPADNGSYTWTVPGTPSQNCLVRISGADADENPSDVSDGVFTIFDPSQVFIEVLTPNGGESLAAGEEYYITWASSGVDNVIIEYSTDNGEQWLPIDTVPAIGGRFTWTVPSTPSDSCLIRISGNTPGDDPFDVSDAVFSIIKLE